MQQHSLLHEITKLSLATSSRNRIFSSRAFSFRQGSGKTNKQLGLDSNQLPKITTRLVSFIHIFEQQLYIVIL